MAPQTKPTRKRRERIAQVLRYREVGLSYAEIAQRLKVSESTVRADAELGLQTAIREPAEEILLRELAVLDRLTNVHMNVLFGKAHQQSYKAICDSTDRLLRIMERRAKYLGLDNPTRVETTTTGNTLDRLLAETLKTHHLDQTQPQ